MKAIIIALSLIQNSQSKAVPSCPRIACSETDFATDEDDWCLRVNFDEKQPNLTTVTIRECKGATKQFCDYARPGQADKMIWPFSNLELTGNQKLDFWNGKIIHEAKCIDVNAYYGRSELYPGWNCLLDMDCHSKKCLKGKCVGRTPGQGCNANIDCISGTRCDTKAYPPVCKRLAGQGGSCSADDECKNGLFCALGLYCDPYFYKKDGQRQTADARQCISGMSMFSVNGYFCKSVGYTKYGPFRNRVTNKNNYLDIPQASKKCSFGSYGFNDKLQCWNMDRNERLYPDKFHIPDSKSPFFKPEYLLSGRADVSNCFCNSFTEAYCIPQGSQAWWDVHLYWKYYILPGIQNIHTDHQWRYDLWLQDPNSRVTAEQATKFAELIAIVQRGYIKNENYRECLNKINPFVQRKWIDPDYYYKGKVDETPNYFYKAGSTKSDL